ncbi:MAG: 2-phospho-L-lactate transferase [Chloroflexota bacterium]|nr:MAG: 2-phospho-L-lactate transferase [Chloroflexota bacterium]
MILALCGGVGGSKMALGLYRVLPLNSLYICVNTADDLDFWGLRVCPDLDTVMYTLAGLSRPDVGWGIDGDTFQARDMLARYGAPDWFAVGDRDLATDVFRTDRLASGDTLTRLTEVMSRSLGVRADILPMTDDIVETRLLVDNRWLEFQEYFVRRGHRDPVEAVRYRGVESARPTRGVLEAVRRADIIVIVNSNPVLSILPALSMPDLRAALAQSTCPRVAISPIVGGDAVTGPAGELMRLVGEESSCLGVARLYESVIDGIVIDERDADRASAIKALGMHVLITNTIMHTIEDRERAASETLTFARSLR